MISIRIPNAEGDFDRGPERSHVLCGKVLLRIQPDAVRAWLVVLRWDECTHSPAGVGHGAPDKPKFTVLALKVTPALDPRPVSTARRVQHVHRKRSSCLKNKFGLR